MDDGYNALDNQQLAEKLKRLLILERDDVAASVDYAAAIDPHGNYNHEFEFLELVSQLIGMLHKYIGENI